MRALLELRSMSTSTATTVKGRKRDYVLGELIGRGASSHVYRAVALDGQGTYAIKLLSNDSTQDNAGPRFEKEMKILLGLQHPHILAIHDVIASPRLGIATDLISGPSMDKWLEDSGPMKLDRLCICFERLSAALKFAHMRGVIHRDVKPDNILMRSVSESDPVLCDFGLAKLSDNDVNLTAAGKAVGTVDYMSPEQVLGEPLTAAVDVYALGCAMYQAATGRVPFVGSKLEVIRHHASSTPRAPSEVRENLPQEFDAIVLGMLQKDPARRPDLDFVQRALGHVREMSTSEFDRSSLLQKLGFDRQAALARANQGKDED